MKNDEQRVTCREYLEGYLKENDLEVSSITIKDVDSMKIDGVSRQIKREILGEMKDGVEGLKDQINRLTGVIDDWGLLYDFSKEEVDFIHDLFKNRDKLLKVSEGQRELGLKKDDDKEVLELKEQLSDIHKLKDQNTFSVSINKDLYGKMMDYRRLYDMSIRDIVHIGMKDLLEKLERDM
jgi:hypothetical protein